MVIAEAPDSLPFAIARYFMIARVPIGDTRGDHAHRSCHQFLMAVSGRVDVAFVAPDLSENVVTLDRPNVGLHIPPLSWSRQTYLTPDAVLLVGASEPYRQCEYISDFGEYQQLVGVAPRG
jgi:hypothetical protein